MKYLSFLFLIFFAFPLSAADCTDFSGLWRGTCNLPNGQTDVVRWQIEQQDCSSMWVNGNKFVYGKQSVRQTGNARWNVRAYERFDWQDDVMDYLAYDVRMVGRDNSGLRSLQAAGRGSMEIEGDYLYFASLIDYRSRGPEGVQYWTEDTRCSLLSID